ncbi:MAG: hypothetical protein ACJASV_001759 [Pseudorhodobacter sp.]|jgi:hypothetical protein
MSKETQAALISEIGEMIVEDERYLSNPWQGIGIAVTLNEGSREMSSYRYLEDGSYEAGSPKAGSAFLRKMRELKLEMENDGDGSFLQCLIHITKPDYQIRFQFEFDNPKRWWPGSVGMDMSGYAEALRPK